MPASQSIQWSHARRIVVGTAAILFSLVWTQALGGLTRLWAASPEASPAAAVSVAAILVAAMGSALLPRRWAPGVAAAAGLIAVAILQAMLPGSWATALSIPAVGAVATHGAGWLGRRLPPGLQRRALAHRGLAILWVAMSMASITQMARLSTRMADWSTNFVLTTTNPFWHTHQCLSAYLYGAEMAERGEENIYDARHYPALDRDATPQTGIEGMVVDDPYQYPPQFLLLPKLALSITRDFETLRLGWYAAQVSLFVAVFVALALRLGNRAGSVALWLLPGVLIAFPMLHSFQFGQVHLSVIAVAVAGMLALDARRSAAGGFLLASAILAKLFPAVLLIPLLVRRRIQDLAWTAGWAAGITLVALAVFGAAPFTAFVEYQLPRLGDGAAFAFDQAWPELSELVRADNQGVFGLARKAGLDPQAAAWIGRSYVLLLVVAAGWAGRRLLGGAGREERAMLWLGLLGFASLASPGAWGDYVPSIAIWVLALMAHRVSEMRAWAYALTAVGVLQFFLLGTMPIGDWEPYALMMPISAIGVLSMLALFGTATLAAQRVRSDR